MSEPALRALAACLTVLGYAALCCAIYLREQRRKGLDARRGALLATAAEGRTPTLVLHASQTGQAEALAWRTARWLHDAGSPALVKSLNEADAHTLSNARQALFIASTYGEGDAPDGASLFAERVMSASPDLSSLRYAVLALGDRQYAHFCAFGQRLDQWLHAAGATRDFERIEVDNVEPAALGAWQQRIGGAVDGIVDDEAQALAPAAQAWRLVARSLLNPGSSGAPIHELAFNPAEGALPEWEAGDLARLTLEADASRPRDYSIASIPADGQLQLLVRQERHPDGSLGAASGLLGTTLQIGACVEFRLRANRNFRLGANAQRPLILIGNGSGLAGLRAHLRARIAAGHRDNWLLFGERQAAHDFLCREELLGWRASGALEQLDMVFSRDQSERRHVQHRLLEQHELAKEWIARGAAIYVCGSLQGMASGVDAALRQIVGSAQLGDLAAEGRYRRDVY